MKGLVLKEEKGVVCIRGESQVVRVRVWIMTWTIYPISTWVISHEEHERRLPCSFVCPIVMYELCDGNIRDPILLVIVDVEAKVLFNPLIGGL